MDANLYVDGFNLYYRALRNTPWRWLDLQALGQRLLEPEFALRRIRYFTALIRSGSHDPGKEIRQQTYLRALRTIPEIDIHEGRFQSNTAKRPLAAPRSDGQEFVKVIETREKGSDANLAAYLTRDAAKRDCQAAFVVTGDSDFEDVIRMVRREFNFPVHVIDPQKHVSRRLRDAATSYRHLDRSLLPQCQFPDELVDRHGTITRPPAWQTDSEC